MLSDIVGNGISGILHKWVNYERGWRPRWFVLHDSVHPSRILRASPPSNDERIVVRAERIWEEDE